jgi:hypothetical protein
MAARIGSASQRPGTPGVCIYQAFPDTAEQHGDSGSIINILLVLYLVIFIGFLVADYFMNIQHVLASNSISRRGTGISAA